MRYRPEHKQATHLRILAAAEFLFRQHGFEGASVERVMRAAGLTVGGFYAHFTSKEALLAEALRAFLQKRRERWVAGIEGLRGQEWLSHFTHRYLNRQLRDDPGEGCLMPSLLSDLTRASPEIQATFTEGLDALVREVQARLTDEQDVTARQKAMSAIALCFGAMTLARATSSHPLSNEVLEAAQAFLLGKKEAPPPPVPSTGSGQ